MGGLIAARVSGTHGCRHQPHDERITEKDVVEALGNVQALWDHLFPAEQARILHLLIAQVVISPKGVDLRLRTDGLTSLVKELQAREAA